jgi:hypothetical protein
MRLVLWLLLQAYKAKDRTKYFYVEHWITLLESTGIMGNPLMGKQFRWSHGTKAEEAPHSVVEASHTIQQACSLQHEPWVRVSSEVLGFQCMPELQSICRFALTRMPISPQD